MNTDEYSTFENEDMDDTRFISMIQKEQEDYQSFHVFRQKLGHDRLNFELIEKNTKLSFFAKSYFRKKNQKIDIFSPVIYDQPIGTIVKTNHIFKFYMYNQVDPSIIIKYRINEYSPASCRVLLTDRHTYQENIKHFEKTSTNISNQFPHGSYLIPKNFTKRKWDGRYCMAFQQRNIISSRKNIALVSPHQESNKAVFELGCVNNSLYHIISKDQFSPIRTAAFVFSWLTIL